VKKIAQKVVDKSRPTYQYAYVIGVDNSSGTVQVEFPGAAGSVFTYPVHGVMPKVDERVRIEGLSNDRFAVRIKATVESTGSVGNATITAVSDDTLTVSVQLDDMSIVDGVSHIDWYIPTVGDTVITSTFGSTMIVLGTAGNLWGAANIPAIDPTGGS